MLPENNRIDIELLPAVELMPKFDVNRENIVEVRKMLGTMAIIPPYRGGSEITETKETIATEDGELDLYVFRKTQSAAQAAVLWIHGGGYVVGSGQDRYAEVIADAVDCTVVSVDYRLAPEHPFPAGVNDCYSALEWMVANSEYLGIDCDRIAISGVSAGGGMCACLALMVRDRGGPKLRMQLLHSPMLDNLHDTESGQNESSPIVNRSYALSCWEMYLNGTPGKAASPYASAARTKNVGGLPPAYICVGSEDLLRDESIEYAQRLIAAEVPCDLSVYAGMPHGGDTIVPDATVSRRMRSGLMGALADALR